MSAIYVVVIGAVVVAEMSGYTFLDADGHGKIICSCVHEWPDIWQRSWSAVASRVAARVMMEDPSSSVLGSLLTKVLSCLA